MRKKDFVVGYGKPPKSGQFIKGRSGNPKGRYKGSRNLATLVLAECWKQVRVEGPKGFHMMTKLQATIMQLQNKAAQGHLPSQRELFSLVRMAEEAASSTSESAKLPEADQQMMKNLLRRMQQIGNENTACNEQQKETE